MTTITLKEPIEVGGVAITSVEIRDLRVGALAAYQQALAQGKVDMVATMELVARQFKWPIAVIEEMASADFRAITEAFAPFIPVQPDVTGNPGEPSPPIAHTG